MYKEINGVTFKFHQRAKAPDFYGCKTDIYQAYSRPSAKKVAIFNEWKTTASKFDPTAFYITSYNTYTFSLAFEFWYEGMLYLANITPTCNHLYQLLESE